jgi:hypothetical protein
MSMKMSDSYRRLEMSKKILVLLLVMMVALPASIFGADLLGFKIGPAAMINGSLVEGDTNYLGDGEFYKELRPEDFTFGADARFNFALIEVNTLALFTPGETTDPQIDLYANAGLSVSLLNLLRVGASIGPNFTFYVGDDGITGGPDSGDAILEAALNLRLTADVELGDLSIGASAIFDTAATFNELFEGDTSGFEGQPFDEGKFGVSAMFALF